MSGEKKVRPDAVLKNLPEERQEAIHELLGKQTLSEVREFLVSDGIKVSLQTLSEFRSWYATRLQARAREQRILNMLDVLRKQAPELSEEKLAEYGASVFNLQAIEEQDLKGFLRLQTARHNAEMDRLKLEQRERQLKQQAEGLKLEREKFEFDAAKACLEKLPELKVIGASKADDTTKIEQIRLRLFGQLPEKS